MSVLVLALVLCLASLAWGARGLQERRRALEPLQAELVNLQAALVERQADQTYVQAQLPHFRELQRQGMVGVARRMEWTQQWVASHARMRLSPNYTLQPAQHLQVFKDSERGAPKGLESTAFGAQYHDLEFTLVGVHEQELLTVLEDYSRHVRGRFRVNGCELTDPQPTGLTAKCVLRFFQQPMPQQDRTPAS